ncbi:EVE domain-containing protein [Atopomonas sediminilitoris]|uniref:EVE domain-containing protein n=1 Tax=Atopomonas sediminilitoris TaxID=2919919 RepID=UPI001F4E5C8F|nr:EVE domain-containing protein [Atopomonas sediminilitoris]MCJ8168269.1 EVE domain-containing protein [Atopomonas sediminilitoris]
MNYWLMKSEPDEFSFADLQRAAQPCRWDGVRNYQARNFLRSMQSGDLFLFYHSSCAEPGIAGVGKIVHEAYPDPTALDPQSPYFSAKASNEKNPWCAVDVSAAHSIARLIPLTELRQLNGLEALALVQKGSRLSVMPVTAEQWHIIAALF